MNAPRFDHFATLLGRGTARRRLLAGVALSPLAGLVAARPAGEVAARKKRKKNKKARKPQPNAYGCLDVGKACNGDSTQCCSGVCEGAKPKKGKKDSSQCVAHDTGICRVDFDFCSTAQPHACNVTNSACACVLTTGNAGFCGDFTGVVSELCRDCSQDTDCEEEFGPGVACIVLGGICEQHCPGTRNTACVPACKNADM